MLGVAESGFSIDEELSEKIVDMVEEIVKLLPEDMGDANSQMVEVVSDKSGEPVKYLVVKGILAEVALEAIFNAVAQSTDMESPSIGS